jgi:hypothetical protein
MSRREQRGEMFAELGVVLERLWAFYQAMRLGQPVENAGEGLAQLEVALREGAQRIHRPGSASPAPVTDPRDAEAC